MLCSCHMSVTMYFDAKMAQLVFSRDKNVNFPVTFHYMVSYNGIRFNLFLLSFFWVITYREKGGGSVMENIIFLNIIPSFRPSSDSKVYIFNVYDRIPVKNMLNNYSKFKSIILNYRNRCSNWKKIKYTIFNIKSSIQTRI